MWPWFTPPGSLHTANPQKHLLPLSTLKSLPRIHRSLFISALYFCSGSRKFWNDENQGKPSGVKGRELIQVCVFVWNWMGGKWLNIAEENILICSIFTGAKYCRSRETPERHFLITAQRQRVVKYIVLTYWDVFLWTPMCSLYRNAMSWPFITESPVISCIFLLIKGPRPRMHGENRLMHVQPHSSQTIKPIRSRISMSHRGKSYVNIVNGASAQRWLLQHSNARLRRLN